jgi:hypothetical protein
MPRHSILRYVWPLVLLAAACAPAAQPPDALQASPSPAGEWTIKLTQSGGFAGVMLTVQVSSDGRLVAENQRAGSSVTKTLPTETTAQIGRYYAQVLQATPIVPRSGCADCFLYRLEFTSAGRGAHIEADDTTLGASGAADLIRLLQQLRDEALRAGA